MDNSQFTIHKLISLKTKSSKLKANFGFTLIELLVVLAIVGILSGVVLATLRSSQGGNRDIIRLSDIQLLTSALNLYHKDNGVYPASLTELVPNQLSALPIDPKSSSSTPIMYEYAALGSGKECTGYHLGATLENISNEILRSAPHAPASKDVCEKSAPDFNGRSPIYDVKK